LAEWLTNSSYGQRRKKRLLSAAEFASGVRPRIARLPLKAPIYWRLNLTGRGAAVSDHIDCAIHRMLRLMSLDAEAGGTVALPFTR
jgi:hypothetical protein